MITVKLKLIDGSVDIFTTEKYMVSTTKQMHPGILDVKVYADRKRIVHRRRYFQWFYKKFLYEPVKEEVKLEGAETDKKTEARPE